MAALLGVVSSGINAAGFPGQLAKQAFELRRLWNEVQDAPEDVFDLIDQMEWLQPMVSSMGNSLSDHSVNVPNGAEQCLVQCGKALSNLQKLAIDLSQNITSNKRLKKSIAKIRVIIKKEQLQKYHSRLENALNGLRTACLVYTMNQCYSMKRDTSAIISKLENFEDSIKKTDSSLPVKNLPTSAARRCHAWNSSAHMWGSDYSFQSYETKGETFQSLRLRLQLPRWLTGLSLNVILQHETCGWKMSLYPRTIRPYPETVFDIISNGSSADLFKFLSQSKRTLFDYDENGRSLIHHCLHRHNVAIALDLIDAGVKLDEPDNDAWTPFMMICSSFRESPNRDVLLRRLASTGLLYEHAHVRRWAGRHGTSRLLAIEDAQLNISGAAHIIQQVTHLGLQKVHVAQIEWNHVLNADNLLGLIQSGSVIGLEEFRLATRQGSFPSFQGMAGFAHFYFDSYRHTRVAPIDGISCELDPWRQLLRILFAGATTPEICPIRDPFNRQQTLLFSGIHWLCPIDLVFPAARILCRRATLRAQHWLEDLAACGIDLEEYGRNEANVFVSSNLTMQENLCYFKTSDGQSSPVFGPSVTKFSYGPVPADWTFVWDYCIPAYAREFWQMVEPPPPSGMPGSWIDEE
ncbi:hypothetical protein VHEMI05360 [[Torrubiella] hemipterigena]|uniref:Fungal N-terminal domain-containing protein n=1 Tax=[Torrubiella] hemipterigena TaxID=1531966 RepID=A0A0A1T3W5_9HYPO|nr:hypothetical protein VHEMI05360 [[Torrubiella] hemipterigena]